MKVFVVLFPQMDKRTSIYNRTDFCALLPAQILLTFVLFRVCVVGTEPDISEVEIGAKLLFLMLFNGKVLFYAICIYLHTSFVRLKHLARQTCFYHLSLYIFSIVGAILKGG